MRQPNVGGVAKDLLIVVVLVNNYGNAVVVVVFVYNFGYLCECICVCVGELLPAKGLLQLLKSQAFYGFATTPSPSSSS